MYYIHEVHVAAHKRKPLPQVREPIQVYLDVRDVTILMDGRALGRFSAPPYSLLWQIERGEHSVQATGMDAAGRVGESARVRCRGE